MAGRKPRARPATVQRWLADGIPARTFDRLVAGLAPSRGTAARWSREGRIPERALLSIRPPVRRPPPPTVKARATTVQRWLDRGIPARTFDRLVRELAPSKATAARWRREEVIPALRLEAIAWEPTKPKREKKKAKKKPVEKPERPPELPDIAEELAGTQRDLDEVTELRERLERTQRELDEARRDEAAERAAIQAEKPERPFEDEGPPEPPPPEDVYPLPTRDLGFFRAHDRTDMEGITGIHFDEATGRIMGVNDQGAKVAAYLFTEENGQPKTGPDSLRWALSKDLEEYVSEINRSIRERYGDNTMRGVFGRFDLPRRARAA